MHERKLASCTGKKCWGTICAITSDFLWLHVNNLKSNPQKYST